MACEVLRRFETAQELLFAYPLRLAAMHMIMDTKLDVCTKRNIALDIIIRHLRQEDLQQQHYLSEDLQ